MKLASRHFRTVLTGALLLPLGVGAALAAGREVWVQRAGTAYGPTYARGMALDKSGNVVTVGSVDYGFNRYGIVKYSPSGASLWSTVYSDTGATGDTTPGAVAVDSAGNIVVTGRSLGTRDVGELYDILTVRLSPAGKVLWSARYWNGSHAEEDGRAVATDAAGNIYVAGLASSSGGNGTPDAVIVKYSPAGKQVWARTFDGADHDNDGYFAIALDAAGNVFATGFTTRFASEQDYLTVKYSPAGVRQWARTYDGGNADFAASIAVDKDGNAVVTGGSAYDSGDTLLQCVTLKYSPAGKVVWKAIYRPRIGSDSQGWATVVDAQGNAYVTGQSSMGGSAPGDTLPDFATLKYAPAGKRLWVARYAGPDSVNKGTNIAHGLAVDGNGNVLVVGQSYVAAKMDSDFSLVKYDANGKRLWTDLYGGPGQGTDMGWFVAVDATNAIYAVGSSVGTGGEQDAVTIKYRP